MKMVEPTKPTMRPTVTTISQRVDGEFAPPRPTIPTSGAKMCDIQRFESIALREANPESNAKPKKLRRLMRLGRRRGADHELHEEMLRADCGICPEDAGGGGS
jgi:hypothetical protein